MAKNPRRLSRRKAFQILYGLSFVPVDKAEKLREAYDHYPQPTTNGQLPEAAETYAWELVSGVWGNQAALDEVVGRFSQHWKLGRIGRIELTILRLALFEMLHRPDIPLKVAINEAVELAKTFGDDSSGNFVNGILDAAAKAVEQGQFGISKGL